MGNLLAYSTRHVFVSLPSHMHPLATAPRSRRWRISPELSAARRGRDVPTALCEDGGIELGVRQTGRMFELLGQGQRLLTPLLGIAQAPEKLGH